VFSSIRVVKVDLIVKTSKYVAQVRFGDGRLGGKVLGVYLTEVRTRAPRRVAFKMFS
jgi:hypothetical protein